jgi:hypothetical protein
LKAVYVQIISGSTSTNEIASPIQNRYPKILPWGIIIDHGVHPAPVVGQDFTVEIIAPSAARLPPQLRIGALGMS